MNKVKTKSGARVMPAYVTNGAAVGVTMARKAQSWGHIDEVELCQRLRRSTGFQMAPCGLLAVFDEIAEVLREGYDVHLSERCRFFTCVNKSRTQLEVTPDMQVTCPNCGTTFRVGRRVAA